ncbi:MAG: L,D-transpeptidase [Burkholderiaceae bacterium]
MTRNLYRALAMALVASAAHAKAPPRAAIDPQAAVARLNAADAKAPFTIGARGPVVARAQVLLDRAWFSPGEIDGRFSQNMRRSLLAFQRANGLPTSGRVDVATWQALRGDTAPAFVLYTVSEADLKGPFVKIPADMNRRAELPVLGYESIREALGERFHMSPALLAELNPGRSLAHLRAGDRLVVANPPERNQGAPTGARSIEIDKSDRTLLVLGSEAKILAAFPISIGGPRDPLPLGKMKITNEVENPSFTFDPVLLKSAPKGAVKTEIRPWPNNPVGNMWLGLSKPHWGIHGTPDPSRLGRAETNGCIHLTNWDAHRLSTLAKAGFAVEVRE